MGIHLYLLSANPPTFVIVAHDLTDLYYQPMYNAKIRILKNSLYLKCLSDENKKNCCLYLSLQCALNMDFQISNANLDWALQMCFWSSSSLATSRCK